MKKITEKDLSETKISNPPDEEFKVMVIKTLTGLERTMDELREKYNKEIKNI